MALLPLPLTQQPAVQISRNGLFKQTHKVLPVCPDALYLKMTGLKAEDIFPNLRKIKKDVVNA